MAELHGGSEYRLQVEPEVLIQASQELHSIADGLKAAHRRLVDEVGDLLGHSWQGQASWMFGKDWQEFEKGSQGVIEDAEVIAELVEEAARQYVQQESVSSHVFESIRSTTPRDL